MIPFFYRTVRELSIGGLPYNISAIMCCVFCLRPLFLTRNLIDVSRNRKKPAVMRFSGILFASVTQTPLGLNLVKFEI